MSKLDYLDSAAPELRRGYRQVKLAIALRYHPQPGNAYGYTQLRMS